MQQQKKEAHSSNKRDDDQDLDEFDCPICCKLLIGPTTLNCGFNLLGHTMCLQCIDQALQTNKYCPLCRQICIQVPQYDTKEVSLKISILKNADAKKFEIGIRFMPCIIDSDILAAPKSTFQFRTTNKAYQEVGRVKLRVTNESKFAIIVDTKTSNCLIAQLGTIYSQRILDHIEYLVTITITGRGTVMKAEEYLSYPEFVKKIAFKSGVIPIVDKQTKEYGIDDKSAELNERIEKLVKYFKQQAEVIPEEIKKQAFFFNLGQNSNGGGCPSFDYGSRSSGQISTLQILTHLNLEGLQENLLMSLFFSQQTQKRLKKLVWIMERNDGLAPELKLNFTNPYKGPPGNKSRKVPKVFEKFGKIVISGVLFVFLIFSLKMLYIWN